MSIESGSKNTFNNIDNIPITDLSQDITGGTNINITSPIVINTVDSPSFTDLTLTGNFTMPASTATVGVIKSDSNNFIHNFGVGNNFFSGVDAGNLTNTTANCTGVGFNALNAVTSGGNNAAFGSNALSSNTSGNQNTAIGDLAMFVCITGAQNTAVGEFSLRNNLGSFNTAVGRGCMSQVTSGGGNTAMGSQAGDAVNTGSNMTLIGRDANPTVGSFTNCMALGFNASVNSSNKVRIGDNFTTVIEGQVDWTFTSDENMKENFVHVDGQEMLEKLSELPLTSWNYKGHDKSLWRHYGPTAQSWYKLFGTDDIGHFNGSVNTSICGGDISGVLLSCVKELNGKLSKLEKRCKIQNYKIIRLRELVDSK